MLSILIVVVLLLFLTFRFLLLSIVSCRLIVVLFCCNMVFLQPMVLLLFVFSFLSFLDCFYLELRVIGNYRSTSKVEVKVGSTYIEVEW